MMLIQLRGANIFNRCPLSQPACEVGQIRTGAAPRTPSTLQAHSSGGKNVHVICTFMGKADISRVHPWQLLITLLNDTAYSKVQDIKQF
jgi:hypothetical protein